MESIPLVYFGHCQDLVERSCARCTAQPSDPIFICENCIDALEVEGWIDSL